MDLNDAWEKYKKVLGVNAQAVLQKNNLVVLLLLTKERPTVRESRLIAKLLEGGKRKLILVVRQDRYEVDEEKRVISLKDWEMKMPFEGRLRWFGVQGRLEIHVEDNNFYAHISLTLVGL
ncbi:MAG: hypothetical protein MPF33_04850 [Candidatus Aramenus sp.]|nr:hypothetical protein [Candidatus Aramenus sp.]